MSLREVPRLLGERLPYWWSSVLFPGGAVNGLATPAKPHSRLAFLILGVIAALLFFGQLRAPLLEPQEPRYAEIPRQMLAEGYFVTPVLHGQPYLDKPPLLYWLVMASYQLFGVHDWSARLVPGLAGFLTVLATWWWGRRTFGERAGFWGALVLCLSARFVYLERMLTMDGTLCLCVTAALAAAQAALTDPRRLRFWLVVSAVACGFGLLAKGPVALVLVAPPVLAYRWLDPRCPRFTWRDVMLYLGVMLAVAAPWFVALIVQEPTFAWTFFWTHNVVRFVAPFDHQEPFWFHLPLLLLGMLPWTLLLPGLVRFLTRRSARTAARRPPALGFCLLAFVWGAAFFSASGCKRAVYILPALPPLALALGCYLDVVILRTKWRPFWIATVAATFATLLAGVQLLLPAYNQQFALRKELLANAELAPTSRLTVVCYPQRYDSVSYYLPQAQVRVYTADQKKQLFCDLERGDETLLLVKSGATLRELIAELPNNVEYASHGKQGAVTVGWVRVRNKPPANTLAHFEKEQRE